MKGLILFTILAVASGLHETYGQQTKRPYKCGFYSRDFEELRKNYESYSANFRVMSGEAVASVGAANGYIEMQIAVFIDSVDWTLQDIDTTCLNTDEFGKVKRYHEQLKGSPISGTFALVLGTEHKTNLSKNAFDRIILSNVYHELSDKRGILLDIRESLKDNGELVVFERTARKNGDKHGDCGHPMLWEPEFMNEMNSFGYKLASRAEPHKKYTFVYYTFKKASP